MKNSPRSCGVKAGILKTVKLAGAGGRLLLVLLLTVAARAGDVDLTVLMPTSIRVASSGPAFAAYDPVKNQVVFVEAYFNANGRPLGPKTMSFVAFDNPAASFRITFNRVGAPVKIKLTNGSRIQFTEKNGGRKVKMQIYNKKGVRVMTSDNILPTEAAIALRHVRAAGTFQSPFRIRWESFAGTNREGLTGFFGNDVGTSLADFLDDSTDQVNNLIERVVAIGTAGTSAAAKVAVVVGGYISDGLGVLADKTKSKTVKFIQKAYDLTQSLDSLDNFFSSPSVLSVPDLANGIEDVIETVKDEPADVTTEVIADPPSVEEPPDSDLERLDAITVIESSLSGDLGAAGISFALTQENIGSLVFLRITEAPAFQSAIGQAIGKVSSMTALLGQFASNSSQNFQTASGKVSSARSTVIARIQNDMTSVQNVRDATDASLPNWASAVASAQNGLANSTPENVAFWQQQVSDATQYQAGLLQNIQVLDGLLVSLQNLLNQANAL